MALQIKNAKFLRYGRGRLGPFARQLAIAVIGPKRRWNDLQDEEVSHWEYSFATKGSSWPEHYRFCLDPGSPLQKYVADYLPERSPVNILDVGSGPLVILGKRWKHELRIVAADPNANEYARLYAKYGVTPLCRPIPAYAEELTAHFPLNHFHLVHARNCLDHSRDPIKGMSEILAVLKPGCWALLLHVVNEGQRQDYVGPHQWNFFARRGEFWVRRPGRPPLSVTEKLGHLAEVHVEQPISPEIRAENWEDRDCWIMVRMRKRPC